MIKVLKSRVFISFILIISGILIGRQFLESNLIYRGIFGYNIHTSISLTFNFIIIAISWFYIKKHNLFEYAGFTNTKVKKWWLLLFPVLYLITLNSLLSDELKGALSITNVVLFILYCISVGISEELSIRGFLQSFLIQNSKGVSNHIFKSICIASLVFGLLHLFKFDKGVYGEIGQVFFATFIGFCFGVLLVIVKRLYPLIIAHSLIDMAADFDAIAKPVTPIVDKPQSFIEASLIVLLVLPIFIYGIILFKKNVKSLKNLNEHKTQ